MGLRFGMVSDRVVAVKCGGVSPAPLPILVMVIDVEVFFFFGVGANIGCNVCLSFFLFFGSSG